MRAYLLILSLLMSGLTSAAAQAVAPSASPGPITTSLTVSSRNSRWNDFRDYLAKMQNALHAKWDEAVSKEEPPLKGDASVRIDFILTATGKVQAVVHVVPSSNCTDEQAKLAEVALKAAVYDGWTEPMKEAFGFRQELTMTFSYKG